MNSIFIKRAFSSNAAKRSQPWKLPKYDFHGKPDHSLIPAHLKKSAVILIRHGQSKSNVQMSEIVNAADEKSYTLG